MTPLSPALQRFMQLVECTQIARIESAITLNYAGIGKHLAEWDDNAYRYCSFTSREVRLVSSQVRDHGAVYGPSTRLRYLRKLLKAGLIESPERISNIPTFRFPRELCDTWAALVYQRLKTSGMPLDSTRKRVTH
jgi:hypothetical protein